MNAVSSICMMIDANLYSSLSDEFTSSLKYVDLCLKVRKLNKLIVYNSTVEVVYVVEKENISKEEIDKFNQKWKDFKDEYYNTNFSLKDARCEIKVEGTK